MVSDSLAVSSCQNITTSLPQRYGSTTSLQQSPYAFGMAKPNKAPSNAGKSVGKETLEDDPERGERIADLMRTRGHNVSSLARAADRDRSQVYRWLDGKSMSPDVVGAIAAALETSRTFLVTGKHPDGSSPELPAISAAVGRLSEALADLQAGQMQEMLALQRIEDSLDRPRSRRSPETGNPGVAESR